LIRLLGDFDLAEEALSEAFAAAIEQWPRDGIPENPRAWLVSAGRFKAIDGIRRRARFDTGLEEVAEGLAAAEGDPADAADETLPDDRLRLVFFHLDYLKHLPKTDRILLLERGRKA